jgi:DNA polymerase III subunit epsilon
MSWIEGPLLGFDTETTGVDVGTDRIVTAALVRRDATGTHVRTWLVAPGVEIPAVATAIHGVPTEHAEQFGRPPVEALAEIATEIVAAARAGVPLVAYNASFDLGLLEAELRRHGLPTVRDRLGGEVCPVVDPLLLDRCEDPEREGRRTLVDLCGVYGVDTGRLHTADVDVVATLDVLATIVARYPHVGALDPAALHGYQERAHRASVAAHDARRAEEGRPPTGVDPAWPQPAAPGPPTAVPGTTTAAPGPVPSLVGVG